jgi:hypothetical protein
VGDLSWQIVIACAHCFLLISLNSHSRKTPRSYPSDFQIFAFLQGLLLILSRLSELFLWTLETLETFTFPEFLYILDAHYKWFTAVSSVRLVHMLTLEWNETLDRSPGTEWIKCWSTQDLRPILTHNDLCIKCSMCTAYAPTRQSGPLKPH